VERYSNQVRKSEVITFLGLVALIGYFKAVNSVHFLDHCIQFSAPKKCTVLRIYEY